MKRIVTALVFISTFSLTNAQHLNSKIDSLIQTTFPDKNGPGAVFMIAKKGKPIYHKAFGKANLELGVDLTPAHVFQIGSMTKQFTAIAILMLEQLDKLNVKDPVSRYIPEYPSGDSITIHHLLTHTSGIKDFTKMKSISEIAQKDMTPKTLVDFFKNEPAEFLPGEKFEYNNSGYVLLGYIIELVSGMSYGEFIKKNIFDKAGMTQSYYASDRQVIPNRAAGYHKKGDGYVNKTHISYSVPFSAGSLMSTINDLLKWQDALNQNLLLSSAEINKAFTPHRLNNGDVFTYGYGWHIKEINGMPSREHGGSIFGYKSMAIYIPGEDIYIAGLTNCDCISPTWLVRSIAELTLNEKEYNKQ